jgi:hypothetical protein
MTAGLITGAALLGTAGPSFASESVGTLAPAAVGGPIADVDSSRVRLEALVGTQTQAEIQAILAAGPAESLFDPETGVHSAAFATEQPSIFSRMITMRGPGCGTGDACATSGTIPHGWYGTGSLAINTTGVTKVSAGSNVTTFWYSASQGIVVAKDHVLTLPKSYNLTKLTRS